MRKPITEFEEFRVSSYTVVTDLGSAEYHPSSETITIQGRSMASQKRLIEIEVKPIEPVEDISAGEMVDLDFEVELLSIEDIEQEETIYPS